MEETSSSQQEKQEKSPVCILVLGMAGSGKTTFVQVSLSISH
jgi:signal recognition particle GTPase